jgi:hypothetical protein
MRAPAKRKFNGHWYDRAGSSPTKSKKKATDWAGFQRKVNRMSARVVPVTGGYEIYIRRLR